MKSSFLPICLVATICSMNPLWAVAPQSWQHRSEADFADGSFQATTLSSLGEVSLGSDVQILLPADEAPAVISAVAWGDDVIYAGSGDRPVIYAIRQGAKYSELAHLPGTIVASLVWTGEQLLAGTGGVEAGIFRVDPDGGVQRVWTDPQVNYVWAIVPGEAGELFAASGPNGAVYRIAPDGSAEVFFQAQALAKNILCLARTDDGTLFAGTDQNGLVIRINPDGSYRAILKAQEQEIAAIIPDGNGGVFVATSDAAKAGPAGERQTNDKPEGRAERKTENEDEGKNNDNDKDSPEPDPTPQPQGPDEESVEHNSIDTDNEPTTSQTNPADEAEISPPQPIGNLSAQPCNGEIPKEIRNLLAAKLRSTQGKAAPKPQIQEEGNAVHHVQPDGLVRTIFRKPLTILSMVRHQDRLLLGTGNNGIIYSVAVSGQESTLLVDTEASQISSLSLDPAGRLVFGSANAGSVGLVESKPAQTGSYISDVLDAGQIAQWGTAQIRLLESLKGQVSFSTRSGHLDDPKDGYWSQWIPETPAGAELIKIASPAGRYLQYRLTFKPEDGLAPSVQQVRLLYQVGNLPPMVSTVEITPSSQIAPDTSEAKTPRPYRLISINASDPNQDSLRYEIAIRQHGQDIWVDLADDLDKSTYTWDTRTASDGLYDLRVVASDDPSNPPTSALSARWVENYIPVDNTPPIFTDLAVKPSEPVIRIRATTADATSTLAELAYSIDTQDDWVALLPDDGIIDSKQETVTFDLKDLKPGPHRLAIRVVDLLGNTGYASMILQTQPDQ